jgi:hypothetical protein
MSSRVRSAGSTQARPQRGAVCGRSGHGPTQAQAAAEGSWLWPGATRPGGSTIGAATTRAGPRGRTCRPCRGPQPRRRRRLRRSSSGGRALPPQDPARQAGHWCPSDPPPDRRASAPARSAPGSTSTAWRWDHGRRHRHPGVRLPGHSDRPDRAAHRDHRVGSPRPDRPDRQAALPAGTCRTWTFRRHHPTTADPRQRKPCRPRTKGPFDPALTALPDHAPAGDRNLDRRVTASTGITGGFRCRTHGRPGRTPVAGVVQPAPATGQPPLTCSPSPPTCMIAGPSATPTTSAARTTLSAEPAADRRRTR